MAVSRLRWLRQRQSEDEQEKEPDQAEVNIQIARLQKSQFARDGVDDPFCGLKQERPEDRSDIVFEDEFLNEVTVDVRVPFNVRGRTIDEAVEGAHCVRESQRCCRGARGVRRQSSVPDTSSTNGKPAACENEPERDQR